MDDWRTILTIEAALQPPPSGDIDWDAQTDTDAAWRRAQVT